MKVVVKLFASLQQYLPASSKGQEAEIDVREGITPTEIFNDLGVPTELCHLVVINGNFVAPEQRARRQLIENDALAAWPPIAGG